MPDSKHPIVGSSFTTEYVVLGICLLVDYISLRQSPRQRSRAYAPSKPRSNPASAHHLQRWTGPVLHDDVVTRGLAAHISTLDSPIVVMASTVHGPVGELLSMSPTADLLAKVTCPVLVIGPHVESGWRGHRARLLS